MLQQGNLVSHLVGDPRLLNAIKQRLAILLLLGVLTDSCSCHIGDQMVKYNCRIKIRKKKEREDKKEMN
jgi:hypothetical protein